MFNCREISEMMILAVCLVFNNHLFSSYILVTLIKVVLRYSWNENKEKMVRLDKLWENQKNCSFLVIKLTSSIKKVIQLKTIFFCNLRISFQIMVPVPLDKIGYKCAEMKKLHAAAIFTWELVESNSKL